MAHHNDDAETRLGTDDLLAEALAVGLSHQAAGEQAGLSAKTVQRRLLNPEFVALRDARRHVHVQAACGRLVGMADTAIDVLLAALADPDPSVRLRAVDLVLRQMVSLRRHADLEKRVAESTAPAAATVAS